MRFLAVPEVPSRGLWDAIRRRRQMATWHAVEERDPPARDTLWAPVRLRGASHVGSDTARRPVLPM